MKKINLILGSIFVLAFLISIYIFLNHTRLFSKEDLTVFVNQFGIWAPFIYGAIYIGFSLIGIPTTILTISGGTLFGVKLGIVTAVSASTIAGLIAFFFTRYFLSNSLEKLFIKLPKIDFLMKKIKKQASENGFLGVTIARLTFFPYMPVSYAAGLVKTLNVMPFFWATLLTNMIMSTSFILLGDSLTKSWPYFSGAVLLVLIIAVMPRWLFKKFVKPKSTETLI